MLEARHPNVSIDSDGWVSVAYKMLNGGKACVYDFPLNSQPIVYWLAHLQGKTWMTNELLGELALAIARYPSDTDKRWNVRDRP